MGRSPIQKERTVSAVKAAGRNLVDLTRPVVFIRQRPAR